MCRGSVAVNRGGRGRTEMFVKITCEKEEDIWCEVGAYVAVMERMLISEIRRKGKMEREKTERSRVE